jgi:hypothetical protein
MRAVAFLVVSLSLCSFAGPSLAAKGPPKLKELGPMQVELGDALSDDSWKGLKAADRCANADRTWMRAMEPEQQNGIDALVEMMAAPVTCWQGAEKKVEKAGDELASVLAYTSAQKHYVESLRAYLFAVQAKVMGDQLNGCKRFKLAIVEAAEATTATEGLVERFTSVESKTLAAQLAENTRGMGATLATEYASLKCD